MLTYSEKIRHEQVRLLYSHMPLGLFSVIFIAGLTTHILFDSADQQQLITWFIVILVVNLARLFLFFRYRSYAAKTVDTVLYDRLFMLGMVITALLWGYLSYFMFPPENDPSHQIAVVMIIIGVAAGSMATLGQNWHYSITYQSLLVLPMLWRLNQIDYDITGHLIIMGILFLALLGATARRQDHAFRDALAMRFAKEEAEAALRESARTNDLLLHSSGEGIYGLDAHGNAIFVNPAAERMLGYSADEMIGLPNHGLIHHTHADNTPYAAERCRMMRPLASGLPAFVDDEVLWRKDGTCFPVEYTSTPIMSEGKCHGVVVNFRDISERRRMEQALAEERKLFIAGPIVTFKWANKEGWPIDYASPNIRAQFGYDALELMQRRQHFSELVHPDDLQRIGQEVANYTREGMQHFEQEYRVRDATGRYRWVYDFTVVSHDSHQNICHYHGYIFDTTERKQAEEALRLAASTFEAHEAIAITDRRGIFLRVNKAFERITGYSAEEAVGHTPRLLRSGRHDDAFYTALWKELATTGHWEGEIWNRRKDGEVYPEWLSITSVRDELGEITHYLAHFQDISERKQAQAYIEYQAFYDALTELPNRRLLLKTLSEELTRSRRHGHIGALLFLDLDRFKTINDSLGHAVGDELLKEVANRLSECIRQEDTAARLGGDEFVILLTELSDDLDKAASLAREKAESIRQVLSRPYPVNERTLNTSPSIGIALFPLDGESASDILKNADIAMYNAKEEGRNRVQFYLPSMQLVAQERLRIEQELRTALEKQQFLIHYQPIVDNNGTPIGAEALLRWAHPEHGLLSPDSFMPVAEESGLIIAISQLILNMVAEHLAELERAGLPEQFRRLAVNVSPTQFERAGFVDNLREIISTHGINSSHLELELTENILLKDIDHALDIIKNLQENDIQFAIDDFGTGYSSLAYLKKLPVDRLKIDRTFVRDIPADSDDAAIVDTIIAMAQTMRMHVVAEGVQTQEQWDYLRHKGCHFYQGYLFHKPMPFEAFRTLIIASEG